MKANQRSRSSAAFREQRSHLDERFVPKIGDAKYGTFMRGGDRERELRPLLDRNCRRWRVAPVVSDGHACDQHSMRNVVSAIQDRFVGALGMVLCLDAATFVDDNAQTASTNRVPEAA